MKILVLEVNEKDQIVTEALIRNREYDVVIMFDPLDILSFLKNEKLDAVFIPMEITGIDPLMLCRKIKQLNPDCILYENSPRVRFYDAASMEKEWFEGCLERPFHNDILAAAPDEGHHPLAQLPDLPRRTWN